MAKWFKEHLGFKTTKAPPSPAPPKPDYRYCGGGGGAGAGAVLTASTTATYPLSAAPQPDILAAYRLQKALDFEDPYTRGDTSPGLSCCASAATSSSSVVVVVGGGGSSSSAAAGSDHLKYGSPKHRLIKVETVEKSCPSLPVTLALKTAASSPPPPPLPPPPQAESDNKEKLIILEDYADPFDAEQAGGTQASVEKVTTENDGYMEPYEAQRMMAEIRSGGRGPKDGSGKQLPLYDTPYEPSENGGGGSDSDPERSRCPRESRLPQDDERPPEEYDQPWEWKKERISKAFAVEIKVIKDLPWPPPVGQLNSTSPLLEEELESPSQAALQPSPGQTQAACDQHHNVQFDGVEKSRSSPTKEGKGRPPQRHSSGCLVNTKMTAMDHCSPSMGERIDPGMPLENQLSSQGFMHMKLSRTKESRYVLGQNSCPFDSVPEIIYFYSSRKLPIKGAEHMSLLYPVAIRTL
ncbi:LOW QUALITY PROTEIN: hypothetical protein CRUP_020801 [Coryphaenoides rupestris]|nr:LOW QUALITY PROTEIN: hypothetical protein CRUP_020801 [Coryphaenoides rupestris]